MEMCAWRLAALAVCTQSCNIAVCDIPWNVFVPFILLLVFGKIGKGNNRNIGKNDIFSIYYRGLEKFNITVPFNQLFHLCHFYSAIFTRNQ